MDNEAGYYFDVNLNIPKYLQTLFFGYASPILNTVDPSLEVPKIAKVIERPTRPPLRNAIDLTVDDLDMLESEGSDENDSFFDKNDSFSDHYATRHNQEFLNVEWYEVFMEIIPNRTQTWMTTKSLKTFITNTSNSINTLETMKTFHKKIKGWHICHKINISNIFSHLS